MLCIWNYLQPEYSIGTSNLFGRAAADFLTSAACISNNDAYTAHSHWLNEKKKIRRKFPEEPRNQNRLESCFQLRLYFLNTEAQDSIL